MTGVKVRGLDELIKSLATFGERADPVFKKTLSRGGVQIKLDWKERWTAIKRLHSAIPHLVRGIGYDTDSGEGTYSVEVGVIATNPQAPLAHIIADGVPGHNAPHDDGLHAMDDEDPKFVQAVLDVTVKLLEE